MTLGALTLMATRPIKLPGYGLLRASHVADSFSVAPHLILHPMPADAVAAGAIAPSLLIAP